MAAMAIGAIPMRRKERVHWNFDLNNNVENDNCIRRHWFTIHALILMENMIADDLKGITDRSHPVTFLYVIVLRAKARLFCAQSVGAPRQ